MPTPPPPTTVQGAVVRLLLADAPLQALMAGGSTVGGEVPEEAHLPHVVVHDELLRQQWVTTVNRIERHRVRVTCYARAATAAGQDNPADVLGLNVERVLDWQDLPLPNTVPVTFQQTEHSLQVSKRRAHDKERVFECRLRWDVTLYRTG